jgi:hypothetical protein
MFYDNVTIPAPAQTSNLTNFTSQEAAPKQSSGGTITITSQQLALDFVKKMRSLDLIHEDVRYLQ